MKYTDLAIESASILQEQISTAIPGLKIGETRSDDNTLITRIAIETAEAAERLKKPKGNYITIESQNLLNSGPGTPYPDAAQNTSRALAAELSKLIPFHHRLKVLVAGIGNEKITPDALGPHTISKLRITRHLFLAYDCDSDPEQANVAAINPGVMAQTGVETVQILRPLVKLLKPDALIAVDSLAARDVTRMNTTIQITDTGIAPGAGTKNHRAHLTKETVGCPVIAIGVPTVIHCQALLNDDSAPDLIVTATNIDQVIHDFSGVIAGGINMALHPGLKFFRN